MVRESDSIYANGIASERLKKEYDSDYQKEVKRELNDARDSLIYAKRRGDTERADSLQKDLDFWKNEMSNFSNNPSHKKLKPSVKKYSYKTLYKMVLDYINNQLQNDYFSITKEDTAISLKCRIKDLDKIFMQLNREGILSQAKHGLMHDSMRYSGEETISDDYTRYSDWASDVYFIHDTKLKHQQEEEFGLE